MSKISNISLIKYRKFLLYSGCKLIRTTGGHEHWARKDLNRSLTIQTHKNTVPEFIIKQHLKYFKISRNEFIEIIESL